MWRRSTRSLRKYEIGTHTDTHTHTEFYSAIKKVGNPAICDNMNEPRVHYAKSEISQTQEDKHCMTSLTQNLKKSNSESQRV